MKLARTSHIVYKIRYHMVTAVKYSKVLLKGEVEECIRETMQGISRRYEISIDESVLTRYPIRLRWGASLYDVGILIFNRSL